jgi:hypothetical protein
MYTIFAIFVDVKTRNYENYILHKFQTSIFIHNNMKKANMIGLWVWKLFMK